MPILLSVCSNAWSTTTFCTKARRFGLLSPHFLTWRSTHHRHFLALLPRGLFKGNITVVFFFALISFALGREYLSDTYTGTRPVGIRSILLIIV